MDTVNGIDLIRGAKKISGKVRVFGEIGLSDPIVCSTHSPIERIGPVSPDGKWVSIYRQGGLAGSSVISVVKASRNAREIPVHQYERWNNPIIRDITDDGRVLFDVWLRDGIHRMYRSESVGLFTVGDSHSFDLTSNVLDQETVPMNVRQWAISFTPDGKVFGADRRFDERDKSFPNPRYWRTCLWEEVKPNKWKMSYVLRNPSKPLSRLVGTGNYVWADRIDIESGWESIRFFVFDGKIHRFIDPVIKARSFQIVAGGTDGSFLVNYDGNRETRRFPENGCLFRPGQNEATFFTPNKELHSTYLVNLSRDGKYAAGRHDGDCFVLTDSGDCTILRANGWRIDQLAAISNKGEVFALATCLDKKNDCYRLKLPISIRVR